MQFDAVGRNSAGDVVPTSATYTATGGTIAGGGLYTAGRVAGTYRVIANTTAGPADTAEVVIEAAPVARVALRPDIAASRPGQITRFVSGVWNSLGDSVPQPVTYGATCGTVTTAGVFTAPRDESSRCLVTASVNDKADTTEVLLLPDTPNQGTPYGIYNLWTSATATQTTGTAPLTGSLAYVAPQEILGRIQAARAMGVRLVFALTGGAHTRYTTNGVFDEVKWDRAMDGYNTSAIRDAVAAGVADGTIIGNSVMDEPQQAGTNEKSWGPPGTMTKARIDGLCSYVKGIFPTLPVGVGHDYSIFDPSDKYQVCDVLISQYAWRRNSGDVIGYRDGGLAFAAREGMAIIFSVNVLNGGPQDKTGIWDCPGTGGVGTRAPNCRVTPAQLRDWGKVLGQAGCAFLNWEYDAAFMAKPANQAAISDVAITLAREPRRPCTGDRRPNTPPTASFASSCDALACSFTDGSSDAESGVTGWSWDFGDGTSSVAQNPGHLYAGEGTYQVILLASDPQGATSSVTHAVTVTIPPVNSAPTAAFSSSCADLTCGFTDESTDADGSIKGLSWDFGDGTGSTSSTPSHTYGAEGSYDVTLTAKDDQDAAQSVTHTVVVTAPAAPDPGAGP
jgi:PKD repeat protein